MSIANKYLDLLSKIKLLAYVVDNDESNRAVALLKSHIEQLIADIEDANKGVVAYLFNYKLQKQAKDAIVIARSLLNRGVV